ncbi:unnamed protein product [Heligmosomoides polygyrus]|uniref:Telomerase reverse transcriptase n=1 Tax=Heligmosomoides polygyrus TaxID=6339 RepID=A0A183FHJ7_HELPZ|nr:unnamed protein product [Heligmosomoides polygyrus]
MHWIGVEERKFVRDYQIEPVKQNQMRTAHYKLCLTLCRPTVQCLLEDRDSMKNEMKLLSACLDGYIHAKGLKAAGGFPRNVLTVMPFPALSSDPARLRRFLKCHRLRQQLAAASNGEPIPKTGRLYFVKADLENCFACVDRDILRRALVSLLGDRPVLLATIRIMLSLIFATFKVLEASQVLDRVMGFLDGIRLTLGGRESLFEMKKGVPQGFELSSRLAHIYLIHFECTYWSRLSRRTCLLRYVDDYLMCSSSREELLQMLTTLRTPNEFGISARLVKCEATFPVEGIRRAGRFITWCGWQIDTKRLKVVQVRSDAQLLQAPRCINGKAYPPAYQGHCQRKASYSSVMTVRCTHTHSTEEGYIDTAPYSVYLSIYF